MSPLPPGGDRPDPSDPLEAQLDAAFAALKPRPGFEADLWERLQAGEAPGRRQAPVAERTRLRLLWTGAGALAAVLVVGIALASLGHLGVGPTGGAGLQAGGAARSAGPAQAAAAFGVLPRPGASSSGSMPAFGGQTAAAGGSFAGSLPALPATLPVYRWTDPAAAQSAAWAARAGAALSDAVSSPAAGGTALAVVGSGRSGREPLVVVVDRSGGTGPVSTSADQLRQAADAWLAALGLAPASPFAAEATTDAGDPAIRYGRLFEPQPGTRIPQVDLAGRPLGTVVAFGAGGRRLTGPAPLALDGSAYPTALAADLLRDLGRAAPGARMTRAELVYVAVPGPGGAGYFEPAVRFTGTSASGAEVVAVVPAVSSAWLR